MGCWGAILCRSEADAAVSARENALEPRRSECCRESLSGHGGDPAACQACARFSVTVLMLDAASSSPRRYSSLHYARILDLIENKLN
jgi:hypothetical protein